MASKPYVVKKGDYLEKVAFRLGLQVDDIWNDPKNADLKALRKNHRVLFAGDLLWLPQTKASETSIGAKSENSYEAGVPTIPVKTQLRKPSGEPLAGEAFTTTGGATPAFGTTTGEGLVELEVPVTTEMVRVTLPNLDFNIDLHVGHLDPATERPGAVQRLEGLGYLTSTVPYTEDAEAHDGLRRALSAFQGAEGLTVTGLLDQPTSDQLIARYGA